MSNQPDIAVKAAFFANYWGQSVMRELGKRQINTYDVSYLDDELPDHWLELRSLENISDEDAEVLGKYRYTDPKALTFVQIGKLIVKDYIKALKGDERITFQLAMLEPFEVDYLRSKSYALPFREYTIPQLIEMGWVKIREN